MCAEWGNETMCSSRTKARYAYIWDSTEPEAAAEKGGIRLHVLDSFRRRRKHFVYFITAGGGCEIASRREACRREECERSGCQEDGPLSTWSEVPANERKRRRGCMSTFVLCLAKALAVRRKVVDNMLSLKIEVV